MQESWAYMHITYRITTCTYTKLIHIHSRGFMHMGLAKSDACWFTRGLWDSLCCSTYPFSRQNHISTKQQGPHQWVNACAKGNISTFARECPGASYWSSFTIEIGSLEEMAGSFPLGNPPFSPCFSTLFQTEMEDFTKTHQEALGLQFLQLASGKLTDSYGKGPVKTWTSTQTRTQAVIPYSCWQNLEQHPFCCHHISILTLIFLVKMVIFVLVCAG